MPDDSAEQESREAASTELMRLGFTGKRLQNILDAARAQGEVMTSVRATRVEYKDGEYTVTR